MKAINGNNKITIARLVSSLLVLLLVVLPLTQQVAYADPALNLDESYLEDTPKEVLKGQIVWADFTSGGNATATNVDNLSGGRFALKMNSVLTINVTEDYIVKAEVVALKPFDASDEYKNRVEASGNDPDDPTQGYRENATNTNQKKTQPRRIIIDTQSADWSNISQAGFNTGNKINSISTDKNKPNAGVTFQLTAQYKNRDGIWEDVKPNVVLADSEESGDKEVQTFITNGEPWELVANVANKNLSDLQPIKVLTENDLNTPQGGGFTANSFATLGYNAKYWVSPDSTNAGLGTKVFGPVNTDFKPWGNEPTIHRGVPIIMSRQAEEVSLYFNVKGYQSAMLGFVVIDEGDAPQSYGKATHMIRQTDGIKQPFIGDKGADVDFKEIQNGADWLRDDVSNKADEGAVQLMGTEAHLNSDGSYTYTLHRAESDTYKLKILADPNSNTQSHIKGWVDFNRNDKFDDNEGSQVVVVNAAGQTELVFSNVHQDLDNSVGEIGMRIRTAVIKENISEPTGDAFSGEVEDFKIHVTYPPRGEKEETTGLQGKEQSAKVDFTAYGKRDYDFGVANEMDESIAVQIVKPDGTLDNEFTVVGEGKYKVAPDGTVTFKPEPAFVGIGTGVVLRAVDKNGVNTGWASRPAQSGVDNINQGVNGMTTMDGVYIPTVKAVTPSGDDVTSSGVQGVTQSKKVTFTPGDPSVAMDDNVAATFADGSKVKVIPGEGKYTVAADGTVTFEPEPNFTGNGTKLIIKRQDVNGTVAEGSFTATVTAVTPTGKDVETTDIQGATQTANLVFEAGDPSVPIDPAVKPYFSNGKQTLVVDGVGTYTVNDAGQVTFEPLKDYTGTPDPVIVSRKDKNGTVVTAKYTVHVTPVRPVGDDIVSTAPQGAVQMAKVTFTAGDSRVPMDDNVAATFADGTTEKVVPGEGKYVVAADGMVTFTPEADFVGSGQKLTIVRYDKNGTKATGSFTAIVTPTGTGSSVTVNKVWQNVPSFMTVPSVKMQLYRNGEALGSYITLYPGTTTYTWGGLAETDGQGQPYHYSVDELDVPDDFSKIVELANQSGGGITTNTTVTSGSAITTSGSAITTSGSAITTSGSAIAITLTSGAGHATFIVTNSYLPPDDDGDDGYSGGSGGNGPVVVISNPNPTDPTEPTDPTDPTEPTEPTTAPTDPTNPTDGPSIDQVSQTSEDTLPNTAEQLPYLLLVAGLLFLLGGAYIVIFSRQYRIGDHD